MSKKRRNGKSEGGRVLAIVVGALTLVLVLYVASMGPATVARERGTISSGTFRSVYRPLRWVTQRSTFAAHWAWTYSQWCGCQSSRNTAW